jgi:Predicted ATPase
MFNFKFKFYRFSALALLLLASAFSCQAYREFILAGGPNVGKSSVVKKLKEMGQLCTEEAFTARMNDFDKAGKANDFWSKDTRPSLMFEYQIPFEKELEKQIDLQKLNDKKVGFVDRSAWDIFFLGSFYKSEMPKSIEEGARSRKDYCKWVFFLDPLPKELYEENLARKGVSPEMAAKEHKFLKEEYQKEGFTIVHVPRFESPTKEESIEKRAKFIIEKVELYNRAIELNKLPEYTFAVQLADIISCFAGKNDHFEIKDFFGPVKLIEVVKGKETYRFFGVNQEEQEKVNFKELKAKFAKLMGTTEEGMIQLVGDTNLFTENGHAFAHKFLKERINGKNMIEYGFSGHKKETFDANEFLNEFVNQNPSESHRFLANVLSQTRDALLKPSWNCSISDVKNFVVVYNKYGMEVEPVYVNKIKTTGYTTFGDDITMSDYLLQAQDGDRLICLEGGPQSFIQTVNSLIQSLKVEFVYNLRKPENEVGFSAARFFNQLRLSPKASKDLTKEDVREIFEKYSSTLAFIINKGNADYQTKQELFDNGMKKFMDNEVYKKIDTFCTFHDAKEAK